MFSRALSRQLNKQLAYASRGNSTIAGTVNYRCNYHDAERTFFVDPAKDINWTYGDFWGQIMLVAGGLTKAGYGPGSTIATDLDHTIETILLQMACAHNGMQFVTAKDENELNRLSEFAFVDGSVPASNASFLQGPTVAELQSSGGKAVEGATDRGAPLAYYGSETVTSNRQVYLHGVGMAGLLQIQPAEQVCVAASLNNAFGMGAVLSTIVRSAILHLPDPKNLDMGDTAVLIADEEGASVPRGKALRANLVKVSAYDYAEGIPMVCKFSETDGIRAHDLAASGARPLFDACSDTYYPVHINRDEALFA